MKIQTLFAPKEEARLKEQARLRRQMLYWSENTLRRTTLSKGESAAGDVICRWPMNAPLLVVSGAVPGGKADFQFDRLEL